MNKGEIFFGRRDSKAKHPIVYLQKHDQNFFVGDMLTKSNNYPNNILMEEKYFKKEDPEGKRYKLSFNNTHLVKAKLMKRKEWKPFKKVGELTDEGIAFVEYEIIDKNLGHWEEYLNKEMDE